MALPNPPDASMVVVAEWTAQPGDGTHEGNLAFCRRVARRLRASDTRWGLNYKRAVIGDPSGDILAYRWGPTDYDCRIVDIISAATGPWEPGEKPAASWTVHDEAEAGPARWFWDEADAPPAPHPPAPAPPAPIPPEPPPSPDPDDPNDFHAGMEAALTALWEISVAQSDAILATLKLIEARQDRPLEGSFKLFGWTVALSLRPRD